MPIYNDDPLSPLMMDHDRGNFILTFQIEFPQSLSNAQKTTINSILEPEEWKNKSGITNPQQKLLIHF